MFSTTVKQLDLDAIRTAAAAATLVGFQVASDPSRPGPAAEAVRSLAKVGKSFVGKRGS